ncbi:hypothetical protein M8J75_003692 [Diaphorina citri]|nr:hypothetical protein M8J75_003692 [Diaphorina citri]
MSPKKSSTDQSKKKRKKLPTDVIILKCFPCAISFSSSNQLIHHIFNEHTFQPTIPLEQVESVPEVLNNYISTQNNNSTKNRKKTPVKPKEKKSPARKRKAPSATKDTSKSKRQKKEKNPPLKAALSIDGSQDEQPKEHKEIPLNNRLEPIENSTTLTSTTTSTSSTAPSTGSNGNAASTDDGLSSLMSEVYNVLDGQDSSNLNLPSNGDNNTDFLEMREIQGLYDDDMTYSHFASAFEIPQSKTVANNVSTPYTASTILSNSHVSDFTSSSYAPMENSKSSSKMTTVDNLTNLSHNLDTILNKPPSSCMLADSKPSCDPNYINPYLMNNSLPNHNMTSSAFTSTNQKPSLTNHNSTNSSSFMMASGSGSSSKVVPVGYTSPSSNNNNMMSYTPSPPVPGGGGASPNMSPHKPMSPHVNNIHPSLSPSSTPGSPCQNSESGKKKTGLNIIPTEKLLDTSSKQNQLINMDAINTNPINSNASVSSYYPLNSMMSNNMSSVAPYGSSYYNSMYPYMNHSSSQFLSSPSHMPSYYNFYPPTSQPIEDAQYKRVEPGPLGFPSTQSLAPPPPKRPPEDPQFKRPPEPPTKQPKIMPKKLSSLLSTGEEKKGPRHSTPPINSVFSVQRPSNPQSISRTPNSSIQVRGSSSIRPPPAPSLKGGPRLPPPPSVSSTTRMPNLSSGVTTSSNTVDTPAASALKKRGITISSVPKPATRKLTSSVNITPVVKKSAPVPDRIGSQVEIVPKVNLGSSRPSNQPAELIKDAECNLGIPVIDLSNQTVLSNLSNMGITSFIPVNQMRGSNQILGLPIISTAQINRRMDDLGATGVLNLGSVYKLK